MTPAKAKCSPCCLEGETSQFPPDPAYYQADCALHDAGRLGQKNGKGVWTAGYGFPRYRGGPLFYAETIGLDVLLAGMRKYQDIFGPMHWQPAPLLVELVERRLSIAQWQSQRTGAQ